jgi:cytochrome c-type biogenesis protein CcmH
MCVVCGTPLNVSESPAADQERALIRREVAAGKTKQQVKQALVAEYGPQVLATPQGGGFAAAAWLVPLAVVAGLVALVAVLLPRWRRRAATAPARLAPLDPADARRLDEELGRYDPSL